MGGGRFDPIAYISISFLSFLFFLIALVTNHWGLVRGSTDAPCLGVGCSMYLPTGVRANYGLWKVELKYPPANYDDTDSIDQNCASSLAVFSFGGVNVDLANIHLPGDGDDCDKFNAVRAMVFLAMFSSFMAVVMQAVVAAKEGQHAKEAACSAFFSLFAAACGMIAMAIYAHIALEMPDAIQDAPQDFGFSFWCNAIGGWPISLLAALIFLVGVQPDEEAKAHGQHQQVAVHHDS